jgi:gas vesicle protein
MSEHTQNEGSSIGKIFGKVRRSLILTDEEIQKHKELTKKCTDLVQQKINYFTARYGNISSMQDELVSFQAKLIQAKIDYLKTKEREETTDLSEETDAFRAFIDDLYKTSGLRKLIDEHDAKSKGTVLDITHRIEKKIHRAS